MGAVQTSAAHLKMSDVYMSDATSGALSLRGAADAAFDSGYAALLSALTRDERVALDHPSEEAIVLASRRLGLEPTQGTALGRIRYSAEDWPALVNVVAWAEGVRVLARARALENR